MHIPAARTAQHHAVRAIAARGLTHPLTQALLAAAVLTPAAAVLTPAAAGEAGHRVTDIHPHLARRGKSCLPVSRPAGPEVKFPSAAYRHPAFRDAALSHAFGPGASRARPLSGELMQHSTQLDPATTTGTARRMPESLCTHRPTCPTSDSPDHEAARVVATHPEQGWALLCNAVLVFEDTGELLPDGQVIAPHRPPMATA